MGNKLILLLTAILFLAGANASASAICTDRNPAAVAQTLGIDLEQEPQRRTDKPNVVIITVDDMGYAGPGVYGGEVPTPNIDRIAAGGAMFTNGYAASSICSPSRAGLMTGKQPNTIGYALNIIGKEYLLPRGLPFQEKTIADYFKEANYVTGMIGKWHLGESEGYLPHDRGFDEYLRWHHNSGGYYPEQYWSRIRHNLDQDVLSHLESCTSNDKYLTDVQGLEATSFVLRHRDEPFLLYFSTHAPHVPIQPRKESLMSRLAYYRHPGYARHIFNRKKRTYFRMLMQLDEAVGHVLDAIDLLGLSENTLILFFSDNGGHSRYGQNGILRGHKGRIYEGGIRVPFMVRWPGTIAPAVHEWPITSLDILPTSLAAVGFHPESDLSHLSGMNILPYLKQESPPPPARDFYWRNTGKNKNINKNTTAIRSGDWKLVVRTNRSVPYNRELYNLKRDVSEQNNLMEKEPEILKSLQRKLIMWDDALPKALW